MKKLTYKLNVFSSVRSSIIFLPIFVIFVYHGMAYSEIIVDQKDTDFFNKTSLELELMREGKRGLACQVMIKRMDEAKVTTTIKPITSDETTWHPNDRKGTRSHVVPVDTKMRGAARSTPSSAVLYLHPSRIDPALSLFYIGTFVHELALAMDMNTGQFAGDYRIVERRATFFKNSWKDSLGKELVEISDRVPTVDYQNAKKAGLISVDYGDYFPILDIEAVRRSMQQKALPPSASMTSPSP